MTRAKASTFLPQLAPQLTYVIAFTFAKSMRRSFRTLISPPKSYIPTLPRLCRSTKDFNDSLYQDEFTVHHLYSTLEICSPSGKFAVISSSSSPIRIAAQVFLDIYRHIFTMDNSNEIIIAADGDLILACGSLKLRVSSQVLASQSSVFKQLLLPISFQSQTLS